MVALETWTSLAVCPMVMRGRSLFPSLCELSRTSMDDMCRFRSAWGLMGLVSGLLLAGKLAALD